MEKSGGALESQTLLLLPQESDKAPQFLKSLTNVPVFMTQPHTLPAT